MSFTRACLGNKPPLSSECRTCHVLLYNAYELLFLQIAIEPKSKADSDKMGQALYKLAQEDPSFHFSRDDETNQTVIEGMGELHLDIIVDRMKREFNVTADVGAPQVRHNMVFCTAENFRQSTEWHSAVQVSCLPWSGLYAAEHGAARAGTSLYCMTIHSMY